MPNKKALKSDWGGHEPMPKEHVVLSFQHEFSLEDFFQGDCVDDTEFSAQH